MSKAAPSPCKLSLFNNPSVGSEYPGLSHILGKDVGGGDAGFPLGSLPSGCVQSSVVIPVSGSGSGTSASDESTGGTYSEVLLTLSVFMVGCSDNMLVFSNSLFSAAIFSSIETEDFLDDFIFVLLNRDII